MASLDCWHISAYAFLRKNGAQLFQRNGIAPIIGSSTRATTTSQQRFSHFGNFSMEHRTSSISITRPDMLPCVRRV